MLHRENGVAAKLHYLICSIKVLKIVL